MRIRRYAARLLSSSGSATTTNPTSLPPPPAASWLHAAADDCCAFCELNCSAPQEAPDAIKHKGHIAGRVPESDVRGDERVGLAQRPPAPEVKKCKIDHGPPVNEVAVGLGVTRSNSAVSEAAAKPERFRGAALISKANTEPAVKAGPLLVNAAAIEQEVKRGASLVSDASKTEVTGGNSLVNGSITELEVLKGVPAANEVATDPEVPERVSLENKAAAVPGIAGNVPEVTGVPSRVNESGTRLEVIRRTCLVNEAFTGPEHTLSVSLVSNAVTDPGVAVTDPGVAITVPEVSGTGSLSNGGAVRAEVTGGASLVHEAAELEATGEGYISSEAAAEAEDSGRASCNVDDDVALDESLLPNCDLKVGNLLIRNARETVASTVLPSQCDAADVSGSINSASNGPVRAKSPTVEAGVPHDRSVTPSVSCVLDIVARSIGRSERTDVICYARRRGKRKLDLLGVKTENIELDDGVICDEEETLERIGPCESVTTTAGSSDVKLADIKRELMDNSAARKVKMVKVNRFECDIDYCRMTFKTKTELSVHKKNMCTVKSCSRHFRSHKYLRRHQSVHNDDMPYKCPWEGCGMAFKWSWDRAEHFQVHAGVKPYKCTTPGCSKIYKFVSDFTRHRRRCKPQSFVMLDYINEAKS